MGGVVGECVNSCTVQLSITNWRKESRMLFAVNYDESIYSRVFGVVASVQKKVSIKGRWKNARHIYIYIYIHILRILHKSSHGSFMVLGKK